MENYDEAVALADQLGHVVCGTLKPDGTPVYFTMPDDANDEDVHDAAFQARVGRPVSNYERMLRKMAAEIAAVKDEVAA